MKSPASRAFIRTYLWIILGSIGYCIGFNWLFVPNQIGFGGITGIAQVLNALIPALPIGGMTFVMNLPLFYFGWRRVGTHLLVSSLFSVFLTSWGLDVLSALHTFRPMDPMLAAVFGGLLSGVSIGIIFAQGATTGGTDLAARLVKLKFPWLPLGKVLLVLDVAVLVAVGLAFGRLSSTLYGIVAMFISSHFTDMVLYGLDNSRVALVISDRPDEVSRAITSQLDRGATVLHATGAYSGQEKKVLMCAFSQKQIVALKRLVFDLDPSAFVIVCSTQEVTGNGFRPYQKNEI